MQPMENVSRRQLTLILGGFCAAAAQAQTQKPGTTIHQEVDFKTTPARIYDVLLDAKQFSVCYQGAGRNSTTRRRTIQAIRRRHRRQQH